MSIASLESAETIRQNAVEAEAASQTYLNLAKSVSDLYGRLKSFRTDLSDIGQLEAVKTTLEGGAGTRDYAAALEYLAQEYGVTEQEAAGMADQLAKEIQVKRDLTAASIQQARTEAQAQIAIVTAKMTASAMRGEEIQQYAGLKSALQGVIQKYGQLADASGQLNDSYISAGKSKFAESAKKAVASTVNEAL